MLTEKPEKDLSLSHNQQQMINQHGKECSTVEIYSMF